ncbi:MAG: hypothetical protein G01um101448_273 [Parcubacteria group bacterium Gr01-1014_48]|nr:MAG: hypothetical protein G01um101448_273 [Parcubacteria group bacterium Gr01-1014_48]TSD01726.1 MAG: hypothetical protein Greene101415_124 [Parcubacteria group bacterium Greene1014_15]TSD07796.1 MAG: hypothetical protein Greene07144_721 [Parcubacteria group bacterium Greene0714_4]
MLQQQIREQIKEAMKARQELRLSVLRGMLAAFINELVATKRTPQEVLSDEEVLVVIKRLAKQRKDSIDQFRKGNREDLAGKEESELVILESYLPQTMSREEIAVIANEKMAELGVTDKTKMGMIMGALMKELKGKADGGDVKAVVEGLFS